MNSNERQVGGNHYQKQIGQQHWDVVALFGLDYFQGNISKYIFRWRDKGGIADLQKARHYLDKYIEIEEARARGQLTIEILRSALRDVIDAAQEVEEEPSDTDDEAEYNVNGDGPLLAKRVLAKRDDIEKRFKINLSDLDDGQLLALEAVLGGMLKLRALASGSGAQPGGTAA